jgi:hypothetical protein
MHLGKRKTPVNAFVSPSLSEGSNSRVEELKNQEAGRGRPPVQGVGTEDAHHNLTCPPQSHPVPFEPPADRAVS